MSTRQRSDKTKKYKASFIYITPSILAKISFILGPISITPIVYKNQVSGHGFWAYALQQIEKIRLLHEILIPKKILASLSPPIIIFFTLTEILDTPMYLKNILLRNTVYEKTMKNVI
jgi:hypothetical protein